MQHVISFLMFLLPVWFLGQAAALAENYLEHHKAAPGDARTNSVSCYNPLYNFFWFNNGYHQEHHCKPAVHWTKVKDVRGEMLPPRIWEQAVDLKSTLPDHVHSSSSTVRRRQFGIFITSARPFSRLSESTGSFSAQSRRTDSLSGIR